LEDTFFGKDEHFIPFNDYRRKTFLKGREEIEIAE